MASKRDGESSRQSVRNAAVGAASALVSGELGVVEAARKISRLGFDPDTERDEDVLFFVGLDSETDHFPIGKVRDKWSTAALAREDKLREGFERSAREDAIKHAHNLIKKYWTNAV